MRFGWFDFIDDLEVSRALLDTVAAWGKARGMDAINGPVGFTDFDHEGLLLEGYEYPAVMASLYNYPYYVKHVEKEEVLVNADDALSRANRKFQRRFTSVERQAQKLGKHLAEMDREEMLQLWEEAKQEERIR